MSLGHAEPWTSFDPKNGVGRTFVVGRNRVQVSTLDFAVWYLEGPSTNWNEHADLVSRLLTNADGEGFVFHLPWYPKVSLQAEGSRRAFPTVVSSDEHLLLARGISKPELFDRFSVLNETFGTSNGLWRLGSAISLEAMTAVVGDTSDAEAESPIFLVAKVLGDIGCALCIDDGMDALFVRTSSDALSCAAAIAAQLKAVSAVRD